VNNTSIDSTRIDGTSDYAQFNLANKQPTSISFRYLGMRTIANATDLHYRLKELALVLRRLSLFRDVASRISKTTRFASHRSATRHTNKKIICRLGLLGIRIKPLKAMTINLESEIGRANQPFTRVCLPRQQGTRRGWFEGSRWMSFCVPAVRGV
jgi:hypothetical protein